MYDNNSKDSTDEVAREAGAVVRYEYKQGKGNVIRTMFREVDAKVYLMVDGDDTYPAENAREMVDLVLNRGADMVVGDRLSSTYFTENKRPFHNFGNSFVRFAVNRVFKTNIKDIMTGYRAFSYEFVKTFPVISKNFEIETEMTIHAVDKNLNIENVVIDYRDRAEGSVSKLNTVKDGVKVVGTIVKMMKNHRPLEFFSIISAVIVIIAALLFCPVLVRYLNEGVVTRIPTVIVCGFMVLSALISWFSGLMLSNSVTQSKHNFEFRLHQASDRFKELNRKNDARNKH